MAASLTAGLHGLGVLITRPENQAQRLAQIIRAAGGEALLYPTIEIADSGDPMAVRRTLASIAEFDWAIFISANAVEKAFSMLSPDGVWPASLPTAAIGAATANALREHGVAKIHAPAQGFDSEALLALPEFQSVENTRIVILRGQGGRETLKQTLAARGAEVVYCECYRRIKPAATNRNLRDWLEQEKIQAINVMSVESLVNLLDMAGDLAAALKSIPVITHHARVTRTAQDAGFAHVFTCRPGDAALIAVLDSLSLGKLA